jgi:uncharacterized protein involved in exopolysaccharide biosynthesis
MERVVDQFPDLADRLHYDASATRRAIQAALLWPVERVRNYWRDLLEWTGLALPPTPEQTAAIPRAKALEKLLPTSSVVLGPSGAIAKAVPGADVIDIGLVAGDPAYAQRVVDAIVQAYLEQRLRLDQSAGPADFFGDQVSAVRQELARSRERLRRFQETEGLVSHEKQESLLLEQVGSLSDALLAVRQEVIDRQARLDSVRRMSTDAEQRLVPSLDIAELPEVQRLSARLADLRLDRSAALERFMEGSPQVERLDVAIRETEASLRRRVEETIRLMEGALETDRARVAALERELADLRVQLRVYPRQVEIVTTLAAEIEDQQKLLSTLVQKLGEERIAAVVDRRIENVRVIRPAAYSATPESPHTSIAVLVGAILGLLVGIGLTLFAESIDHGLHSERDVERFLDLPALASIGAFKRRGSTP